MSVADSSKFDKASYDADYYAKRQEDKHELGPVPKCKYPKIREKCFDSLLYYIRELFNEEPFFTDPFGPVQLSSIRHEEAVFRGKAGNINKLEPRAYGKTSRSVIGTSWGSLTGMQPFTMLCGDSQDKSADMMTMAQWAVCDNEKLKDVFPEVYAFHKLNHNPHAARYQTFEGETTDISIKGDTLYFPKLDGKYPCEESMIVTRPYKKARGKNVKGRRPTLVILDDIQSSEEAASPTSVRKNLKTLTSDIAYLGSRSRPVIIINNATIIEDDDFPSKVCEMDAFTTVRYKMVDAFPDGCEPEHNKWSPEWARYFEIRKDYDPEIVGDKERAWIAARDYYVENQEVMDAGSRVTWDYAYSEMKKEVTTIQAAMNYIMDFGYDSFRSECQNEPRVYGEDKDFLNEKEIALKQHPYGRAKVPPWVTKLVAYVDVQQEVLFWKIWGFAEDDFTGALIERNTYPEQPNRYFQKTNIRKKLTDVYDTTTLEARQKAALLDLTAWLLSQELIKPDESTIQIDMVGVDARYQTDTVKSFYADSKHKGQIQLCMGHGYGAKKKPQRMKPVRKNSGEAKGFGWFLGAAKNGIQVLEMDTNRLKTFVHQRYATALNDPGSFSLWEEENTRVHELDASHICAEYRTTLVGPWGEVDEWDVKPGRPDNDWFDCDVGCVAIASFRGVQMIGTQEREDGRRKRKKIDGSKWSKRN